MYHLLIMIIILHVMSVTRNTVHLNSNASHCICKPAALPKSMCRWMQVSLMRFLRDPWPNKGKRHTHPPTHTHTHTHTHTNTDTWTHGHIQIFTWCKGMNNSIGDTFMSERPLVLILSLSVPHDLSVTHTHTHTHCAFLCPQSHMSTFVCGSLSTSLCLGL